MHVISRNPFPHRVPVAVNFMQCPVGGPGCNTKHAGWASRHLFEHVRYSVGKSMVYMCRNPVCPFFNKTVVGWDPLVLQHLPGCIARSWQSAYTLGPKSGFCTRLVHEASRNGPLGTTTSRMAASHSELEVERYHQLHEQHLLHHHHYTTSGVISGVLAAHSTSTSDSREILAISVCNEFTLGRFGVSGPS